MMTGNKYKMLITFFNLKSSIFHGSESKDTYEFKHRLLWEAA